MPKKKKNLLSGRHSPKEAFLRGLSPRSNAGRQSVLEAGVRKLTNSPRKDLTEFGKARNARPK